MELINGLASTISWSCIPIYVNIPSAKFKMPIVQKRIFIGNTSYISLRQLVISTNYPNKLQ